MNAIEKYEVALTALEQGLMSLDDFEKEIAPLRDVAPVVHGRWIKYTGMGKEQWMCSECSAEEKNPKIARYCYYCGAKMDGEE